MNILFLATRDGFVRARPAGETWAIHGRSLAGENVTSLIAREGFILAGTKRGVVLSADLGDTWSPADNGLDLRHVRWLAFNPMLSDHEFAGTEPAGIFISRDGAATWRSRPAVAALRDRHRWYLPYSPEAGCVRGFAFHGRRVYAAVEVGGLLRSDDAGENWALVPGSSGEPRLGAPPAGRLHPDVHDVAVHPTSPDLLFAPTGGGLYRSADGGATWARLGSGSYVRAVWLDPAEPGHLLAGMADGVDYRGRIERSLDGGATWRVLTEGIDGPWPRTMVERFHQAGDCLLAVLSDGRLLAATIGQWRWAVHLANAPRIQAVTTMNPGPGLESST